MSGDQEEHRHKNNEENGKNLGSLNNGRRRINREVTSPTQEARDSTVGAAIMQMNAGCRPTLCPIGDAHQGQVLERGKWKEWGARRKRSTLSGKKARE